jgi:hypothetical protein
LFLVER